MPDRLAQRVLRSVAPGPCPAPSTVCPLEKGAGGWGLREGSGQQAEESSSPQVSSGSV